MDNERAIGVVDAFEKLAAALPSPERAVRIGSTSEEEADRILAELSRRGWSAQRHSGKWLDRYYVDVRLPKGEAK